MNKLRSVEERKTQVLRVLAAVSPASIDMKNIDYSKWPPGWLVRSPPHILFSSGGPAGFQIAGLI
jgi:hypothetical protein